MTTTTREISAMMKSVSAVVKEYVSATVDPVKAQLQQVEQRVSAIPVPPSVDQLVAAAVAQIPKPEAVDYVKIANGCMVLVADAVSLTPKPKDGIDGKEGAAGKDAPLVDIDRLRDEVLAVIPKPKDGNDGAAGKNADPEAVRELVAAEIAKALAAIPPAKDGKDGKDGENGRDGRDGLPGVPGSPGEKAADGINGKDGADGFGIDDFGVSLDDAGRTFTFSFQRGDKCKAFQIAIPTVLDRGVYRAETQYAKGDGATWDGSWWIAQTDTKDKPGTSTSWRLAVKRGRDGKDGKDGTSVKGDPGREGPRGRDLTQIGPDGSRF